VVRFYNKRGTAEQWIKEGKQATHWTRLSCHRFRANEARLQLSLLAYNLGNLWRRLVLPKRIDAWSLTSTCPPKWLLFDDAYQLGLRRKGRALEGGRSRLHVPRLHVEEIT
jgi:hypothetical protein